MSTACLQDHDSSTIIDRLLITPMTDRLPQVDMTRHTRPALMDYPLLSSQRSGWSGVFFQHYDHSAYESPEHQWTQHIVGIIGRGGHPIASQHRIEGRLQDRYCQPGELLLIPAGVPYAAHWQQAGEFSLLGLSPQFFAQVVHESVAVRRIELMPQIGIPDPLIQQIGLALKADVEANHPAGRLFGESLAVGLVLHLLQRYGVWQPTSRQDDRQIGLSYSQLKTVSEYIDAHLDQDIALSDIAGVLHLSQYHFCRLFKQSTGVTPHHYLTQCRIDRAKRLLQTTKLTVTEVAVAVGFNSHSSFSRLFRQRVGVTPKGFRATQV